MKTYTEIIDDLGNNFPSAICINISDPTFVHTVYAFSLSINSPLPFNTTFKIFPTEPNSILMHVMILNARDINPNFAPKQFIAAQGKQVYGSINVWHEKPL